MIQYPLDKQDAVVQMLSFDELGGPRVVNFQTISKQKYSKIVLQNEITFYLTNEGVYSQGDWRTGLLGFKNHERLTTKPI